VAPTEGGGRPMGGGLFKRANKKYIYILEHMFIEHRERKRKGARGGEGGREGVRERETEDTMNTNAARSRFRDRDGELLV